MKVVAVSRSAPHQQRFDIWRDLDQGRKSGFEARPCAQRHQTFDEAGAARKRRRDFACAAAGREEAETSGNTEAAPGYVVDIQTAEARRAAFDPKISGATRSR